MGFFKRKEQLTRTYFITGTDTGVGKTLVTSALLQAVNSAGLESAAIKPVAAGCVQLEEGLRNEDAMFLQEHMSLELTYDEINPIALEPAIAPHIAAAEADINISVDELAEHCRSVAKNADVLLIEGAGGWRVPLNDSETLADLAIAMNAPVILVVALRLGCINHALLTAEAIRADGLQIAGWVGNTTSEEIMPSMGDNLLALRDRMNAPFLGYLPYFDNADPMKVAPYLEISYL